MNRLVIQTNLRGVHHLWLLGPDGIRRERHIQHEHHGADKLLAEIAGILQKDFIGAIIVVRGPGPFTAVRAGIVIANTLGWLRNIPVAGLVRKTLLQPELIPAKAWPTKKTFSTPVRPWYGRQPNITRSTKRR